MSDGKTPTAGQFMGPTGNGPRVPREEKKEAPKVPPILENPEEEINKLERELTEEPEEDRPLTTEEKEQAYLTGLKEVGLSIEKARSIMEQVLIKGYYEEAERIGPITVRIRTRSYNDTLRAQRYLEAENPTYNMNVQDLVARYNIAASLVQYGDNTFYHPEDDPSASTDNIESAFADRLRFVMGRPAIVVSKLMALVYQFDLKIASVFSEGAPQDF